MGFNIREFLNILNNIWGDIFTYNDTLRMRSDNKKLDGTESFTDIIDFYLTSQAQSFLKGFYIESHGSTGMFLTARCFLEGLAIKQMYLQGDIGEVQIELLKKQVFLIEYKVYKKFDDIAEKILIPEKLQIDYDNAKAFYFEKLRDKFTDKKIKDIIKSQVPFLCNPKTNFWNIIENYLGKEYAEIYGLLSQAIHPSLNTFYKVEELHNIMPTIVLLIVEEYAELSNSKENFKNFFNNVWQYPITREYKKIIEKQCQCVNEISKVFEQYFKNGYVSNALNTIILLLQDMCTDKIMGLCEQVKSKWKILLELFAGFHEMYLHLVPKTQEYYKLLEEHQGMQFKRNCNLKYSLDDAYKIYKEIFPNGVNQKDFENKFKEVCGYTIDEKGNVKTLTQLVEKYIGLFQDKKAPIPIERSMLLNYLERHMLSHANGYMWYTNSGAWGDINIIFFLIDLCLEFMLQSILSVFTIHREVEETNEYKPIINILRNSLKRLRVLFKQQMEILAIPCVSMEEYN